MTVKKRSSPSKPSRHGGDQTPQKKRKVVEAEASRRSGMTQKRSVALVVRPNGARDEPPAQDQRSYFATRLCVRHLPRGTTEDGVRSFLLRGIPSGSVRITDCRVLAKGRECLAFAGVASPADADRLIGRHHRTYLGTSRVVVERAYRKAKDEEEEGTGRSSDERNENPAKLGGSKTLRTGGGAASPAAKKSVLLAADAASAAAGKNKFWANSDAAAPSAPRQGGGKGATDDGDGDHDGSNSSDGGGGDDRSATDSDSSGGSGTGDDEEDDEDDDDIHAAPEKKTRASDLEFLKSIRSGAVDLEAEGPVGAGDGRGEDPVGGSGDDDDDDEKDDHGTMNVDGDDSVDMPPARGTFHGPGSAAPEPKHLTDPPPGSAGPLTSRVFVRNLPYSATEEDLTSFFETAAGCSVVDCHIPVTDQKRPKGFAFVTLSRPSDVPTAVARIDGSDFQGRILHLMPAHPKEEDGGEGASAADNPRLFKDRREEERRKQAGAGMGAPGLSSYVRSDAVVDSLASRMGFRKGDILSVRDGLSSGDAAVRLALGETALIEENRAFLERLGISLSNLEGPVKRSNTCILIKNLPADTVEDELMKMFGSVATTSTAPPRLELAPSRTLAVVSYAHRNDAKTALRRLAYRRFKSVPLYLEWAPLLAEERILADTETKPPKLASLQAENDLAEDVEVGPTSTLHVKNLNFSTTEDRLREFFSKQGTGVRAVRIPQKVVAAKRSGGREVEGPRSLSLGYGFVELGSQESCKKVIKELQGALLDGHALELSPSSAKTQVSPSAIAPPKGKQQLPNKLVIRNVPFQATRKELLVLFGSFGQLKKVRLPKKFDGTHRGFAFVEFMNAKEASAAFKSLSSTHLYGRHLVIEWAADEEESDIDKLRDKAKRNMSGSRTPSVSNQKKMRSS